ncbi:LysR substrate-binding domain-containing protein [Burkholderia mayonis]|nr:LysR substrate-binding domain-containing protein [Burkholderia mayonis]
MVDLVGEAVDCGVRVGALEDSGLVARRIGTMAPCTCATPAYLERYGVPETLDALDRHVGVNYTSMNTGKTRPWCFMDGGEPKTVAMKGIVSVNDADAYVASVLAGLGLGKTSRYLVDPHLKTGALQRVLSRFDEPARPVSILYLPNRNLPHKVRVFIDWLSGVFEKQEALQQSGEG